MDPNFEARLPYAVAVVTAVAAALGLGLVTLVRRSYASRIDRLMREHAAGTASATARTFDIEVPPTLRRDAPHKEDQGRQFFASAHRRQLACFIAAGVAYAAVHAWLRILKVALEDGNAGHLSTYMFDAEVVASGMKQALWPFFLSLGVLIVRRLQSPASGVWIASLITIAAPLGAIPLQTATFAVDTAALSLGRILFRVLVSLGAAYAYVRVNAWRSERSRWGFQTRGLNTFYIAFGLFCFCGLAGQGAWVWAALLLIVPFMAYVGVLRTAFAVAALHVSPRRLLLLRVFGKPVQADRLYRDLVYDWSLLGPIRLIGAPDVARRTMTPRLFAAYLSRRLQREFAWSDAELNARLREADAPFADRTYRNVEILCAGETWRTAVRRMARDSDVVLMDLRGFSARNRGCAWELGQLVNLVPLSKVLLCVDRSTDHNELDAALRSAWEVATPESPNWRVRVPFHVLNIQHASRRAARCAFATSTPPPAG